jgi:hypothetical protein
MFLGILLYKQILYIENNVFVVDNSIQLPFPPITKHMEVPRIIHQIWRSQQIPDLFSKWMQSWKINHPDWHFWFWTDADCLRLIKERYPTFLELYQSYPEDINRADVTRYFILYEFGGIYADLDMESSKSMELLLPNDTYGPCFLSQEPLEHAQWRWNVEQMACNALMACRRRHPFFASVLQQLQYQKGASIFPFLKVNRGVMYATGPLMITGAYDSYNDTCQRSDHSNCLHLVPSYYFYPTVDPLVMNTVKSLCRISGDVMLSDAEQAVCERHRRTNFSNEPVPGHYGNHHWVHMYYKNDQGQTSNIKNIMKNVTIANDVI